MEDDEVEDESDPRPGPQEEEGREDGRLGAEQVLSCAHVGAGEGYGDEDALPFGGDDASEGHERTPPRSAAGRCGYQRDRLGGVAETRSKRVEELGRGDDD